MSKVLYFGGLSLAASLLTSASLADDKFSVQVNLDVKHQVGAYDSFERERYITMHATHNEHDWFGGNPQSLGQPNEVKDLLHDVIIKRDVYFGRDTGGMKWQVVNALQNPKRPGWVDPAFMNKTGKDTRWWYSNSTNDFEKSTRKYENRNTRLIVGAQQRPYWPDGGDPVGGLTPTPWNFSTADTEAEPLGSAVGDFMGLYIKEFFRPRNGKGDGQLKPLYVEIMNEPLFELVEYPGKHHPATVEQVMHFHNAAADQIRKHDSEVLIGGYTAAFPNFEVNNFQEWENTDKLFMDVAGQNMDFISIHLYDFPNIPYGPVVREQYRKGSNMEATLDMLDAYMASEWGKLKPIIVSEYGSQLHGMYHQPWSSERDWLQIKAFNSMLMQFLERPDRIEQSLPFTPLKAEWGRNSPTVPYYWRLMIQAKERPGQQGEQWVYSDLIHFYDQWVGVAGTRIDSWSSDPDVQVDAYVDDKTLYLIANSLEFKDITLDLDVLGLKKMKVKSAELRHLYLGDDKIVKYEVTELGKKLPQSIPVGAEATSVLVVNFNKKLKPKASVKESRHFAKQMNTAIEAGEKLRFDIDGIKPGKQGEALLRLGVGRNFGLSLEPSISLNGSALKLPTDYRGYNQYHNAAGEPGKARDSFFGVLEIPVPYELLKTQNIVELSFPDSGGKISSVALQNMQHSKAFKRSAVEPVLLHPSFADALKDAKAMAQSGESNEPKEHKMEHFKTELNEEDSESSKADEH
ncbi:agarase [Agaribacterium haliotis]|uniref:agarase n=1 Tax=Agaribacterium haliotis TaxID=2013869 RepID=UPI000BB5462F|nr:agarase [Agaribacterium haliotis]